jgi:hypothetical protein
MEPAGLKSIALSRLSYQVMKLVLDGAGQDKAREPGVWITCANELPQLATRCCEQRRLSGLREARRPASIRPGTKLLCETHVALLILCRSKLHSEIEEAGFVPLCMALDEPYELLR